MMIETSKLPDANSDEVAGSEPSDLFAGYSNLKLPAATHDYPLGSGLSFRSVVARLDVSNKILWGSPEKGYGQPLGAWNMAAHVESYNTYVELFVPKSYTPPNGLSRREVIEAFGILMRLFYDGDVQLLISLDKSLSTLVPEAGGGIHITSHDIRKRYVTPRRPPESEAVLAKRLSWIKENWQNAVHLMSEKANFKLAFEAYGLASFIPHPAPTLVSLWGALEALFSPSTTELRFRISILIASYLHRPGAERAATQKKIAKLYDARSAAAHGKPKEVVESLLPTFNVLQSVLIKMIQQREVPGQDALEEMLFGVR